MYAKLSYLACPKKQGWCQSSLAAFKHLISMAGFSCKCKKNPHKQIEISALNLKSCAPPPSQSSGCPVAPLHCVHVKCVVKLCSPNNIQFQALHIHYPTILLSPSPRCLTHTALALGREQYVEATMV